MLQLGTGNGDGQYAREWVKTKELQKNQRPEELVNGADKSAKNSHRQGSVSQRHQKTRGTAKCNPDKSKSNRSQQCGHQPFSAEKVGRCEAKQKIAEIAPGVGGGYRDVRKQQPNQGDGKKSQADTNRWGRGYRAGRVT